MAQPDDPLRPEETRARTPPERRPEPPCRPDYPRRQESTLSVIVTTGVVGFHLWLLYRVIRMSSQVNKIYRQIEPPDKE